MAGPAAASITPDQPGAGGDDTGQPSKLGFVKASTLRLLDLMHDGDAVALVVFDDTIQVVKPLTVLGAKARTDLATAIKGLETGGSTNIEGGLKSGLAQFSKAVRKQFGCKLVLLSDGEANVGEQRPAVLGERAAPPTTASRSPRWASGSTTTSRCSATLLRPGMVISRTSNR